MISRYASQEITEIWSDEKKVVNWQKTELAVIEAMANLGQIDAQVFQEIRTALLANPIDIFWWKAREKVIGHDLNAFVDERVRFLPPHLQIYFHQKITSYDTEEPAFAAMLRDSLEVVENSYAELDSTLVALARRYRYCIMNGRTHGQEAKLQSFGKRVLTWLQDLRLDFAVLEKAAGNLLYSKLSGAIGNYGSLSPELEKETLRILGLQPYYGSTQIMPREIYAPLGQALCQIVLTLDKIATAIRLGARSGRPIYQEPFGRKQKGSSAMPHKKNTISTEQIEGMARLAQGYLAVVMDNIKTWEERAIEQSCAERVAWPDLFHVVVHSLRTMTRILSGLVVYPDNMLLEIVESRGCYAADEAKELLKELGVKAGLAVEEAYRIVQLAAFNAFEPPEQKALFRSSIPGSLEEADESLERFSALHPMIRPNLQSIQELIAQGKLRVSPELDSTPEQVQRWNDILRGIFSDSANMNRWSEIFRPSFLLKNEEWLYQMILEE